RMAPEVTGLSPKYGPCSGDTKLTIRGEGLGTSAEDVVALTVCGVDCLAGLEWVSSRKLLCRTAPSQRAIAGSILVTTASGGVGTCTVVFTYGDRAASGETASGLTVVRCAERSLGSVPPAAASASPVALPVASAARSGWTIRMATVRV